ncbi:hypothetical protein OG921_24060 [Aldersonia sp. NBC_00410]|uniref:hypothetical protein n=1 Tax=Aldersonia sp. NBC_00410 TaxID=2975954 RepID=UPI00225BAA3F|nr:hypothetical protein [Aldersonia sp. NBC_00410]MCX5046250.1 hypothetical protein [Aldersonia sp. NBC_00410]
MTGRPDEVPAGPVWTRGRVAQLLRDCYGQTARGAVDVAAVARVENVSTRTVRRWIAGSDEAPAAIPAARLAALTTGGAAVEKHAAAKAEYAREAIRAIALPKGRGILPPWKRDGWLDQHLVMVLDLHAGPWRQVVLTRGGGRALTELRRRGEPIDVTTVATRFHADVLVHEVMNRMAPWQIQARFMTKGRGQTWSEDAPKVDLSVLAVELGLRS